MLARLAFRFNFTSMSSELNVPGYNSQKSEQCISPALNSLSLKSYNAVSFRLGMRWRRGLPMTFTVYVRAVLLHMMPAHTAVAIFPGHHGGGVAQTPGAGCGDAARHQRQVPAVKCLIN